MRGLNSGASCRVSSSRHKWGSIFRNKKRKGRKKKALHHKLSQQQLCCSLRLKASSSSRKEGNALKRLSFPLIPSFVPSSSVVGRLMTLLTFPVTVALRLEQLRVANYMVFFFLYILCFWSIELQHYKHHRIHEIGGEESRVAAVFVTVD